MADISAYNIVWNEDIHDICLLNFSDVVLDVMSSNVDTFDTTKQ